MADATKGLGLTLFAGGIVAVGIALRNRLIGNQEAANHATEQLRHTDIPQDPVNGEIMTSRIEAKAQALREWKQASLFTRIFWSPPSADIPTDDLVISEHDATEEDDNDPSSETF